MSLTRLLLLIALFSTPVLQVSAQSQPGSSSDLVVFHGAASMKSLAVDAATPVSDPKATPGSEVNSDSQAKFHRDRSFRVLPEAESDGACLFIRSYRVVRDSPRSDSVHRDGYTTCVPAARFRMYTTVDRER